MKFRIGPDVAFVMLFLMLLICIVVPMPGWLLDIFISMNICATILILVISLNISSAVELPSFPSILLITTLFRLSLNVASTRAILTSGDAGRVISAFGNFVISGNYFAGAVVFLIITIIQIVVVTKGAERVAEVSARFTLDAMPGKQMSIDAELRAGHISREEAIRRRENLSIESQFFGSMDGAMKFVKGDAIAGILISIINVVGGILTGMIMRNMALSEAVSRYTILSIGDGLVSQIPSLIISVSAGIIITRISTIKKAGLGKEIFVNLTRKPLMILIASIIAILFSLLPHIPFLPFFLIGGVLGLAYKKLNRMPPEEKANPQIVNNNTPQDSDGTSAVRSETQSLFAEPIMLSLSEKIISDSSIQTPDYIIKDILPSLRKRFMERLGFRMPGVRIVITHEDSSVMRLSIYGAEVAYFDFREPHFVLDRRYSPGSITELSYGYFLKYASDVGDRSLELVNFGVAIREILYSQILKNIRELFGIQETSEIIEEFSQRYPALIREIVPRSVGVNLLSEVLKILLSEAVSIRNMKTILETLEHYTPYEKNPEVLSEFVRVALSRQICQDLAEEHRVAIYVASPELNKLIMDSIVEIGGQQVLSINPDDARRVIESIKAVRENADQRFSIMTDFEVRRFLRKIIEYEMPFIPVLSFKEIAPNVRLEAIGRIDI